MSLVTPQRDTITVSSVHVPVGTLLELQAIEHSIVRVLVIAIDLFKSIALSTLR